MGMEVIRMASGQIEAVSDRSQTNGHQKVNWVMFYHEHRQDLEGSVEPNGQCC